MRTRAIVVPAAGVLAAAVSAVVVWFFSNPEEVTRQEATSSLVTFAVQTLTLSAVVGFAAMATLEMVKRLFNLRGRFFFDRVAGPEFLRLLDPSRRAQSDEPGHKAVVRRFDLPLEQLMAQLNYAADQALDQFFPDRIEPEGRPPLPRAQIRPLLRRAQIRPPRTPDARVRARRDSDAYKFLVRLVGEDPVRSAEEGDSTMLRIQTQAALDDLQVRVGNAWRWRLQLTSSVLAALFALAALIYVPVPPGSKIAALVGSFLLGGFFAGFFRDLVSIVERFRRL
jgi:hypothetical protein